MSLSGPEKLMLTMLADIQLHLGMEADIDPAFVKSAVQGNSWALAWEYPSLFNDEEASEAIVNETADILTMWTVLQRVYEQLPPDDKAAFKEQAQPHPDDMSFPGFDANNDKHFYVASFMYRELRRFEGLRGIDVNSHSSVTLPVLRGQLDRYRNVVSARGGKVDLRSLLEIFGK